LHDAIYDRIVAMPFFAGFKPAKTKRCACRPDILIVAFT
jgi:hypothetical protein